MKEDTIEDTGFTVDEKKGSNDWMLTRSKDGTLVRKVGYMVRDDVEAQIFKVNSQNINFEYFEL